MKQNTAKSHFLSYSLLSYSGVLAQSRGRQIFFLGRLIPNRLLTIDECRFASQAIPSGLADANRTFHFELTSLPNVNSLLYMLSLTNPVNSRVMPLAHMVIRRTLVP